MEKEIIIKIIEDKIEIKEDGSERIIPLGFACVKDFKDDEIEQLVKIRFRNDSHILDNIKNYIITIIRN